MKPATESFEVERFRDTLARQLGLQFDNAKLGLLADLLRRRLEAANCTAADYLHRLDGGLVPTERAALVQELTVPETYFFRNIDQFRAVRDLVLPERLQRRTPPGSLQLLSAGCATGEEPYSLAMLLRDAFPSAAGRVSIRGLDINPAVLDRARHGRYTTWALRETPPDVQQRWFRQVGKEYQLADEILHAVVFEEHNLADEYADWWMPESCDLIFCRNVLMYFAPAQARAVVARLTQALVPGGYLFLGHAETLRGLSDDFHLCHTHNTFYYQRKDVLAPAARPQAAFPVPASLAPAAVTLPASPDDGWVDAIHQAAARIRNLTASAAAPAANPPQWSLGRALELMAQERYQEALDWVRRSPPAQASDPDLLLVQAALCAHCGQLAAAEEVCQRLLAIDELNAGAHYVLALCDEARGDFAAAADHDQVAAYLDPAFAMPRLHLGLLARRGGRRETARRELGQALVLLQREEALRLLLFGGGFNRSTLLALCEAELQACGGAG